MNNDLAKYIADSRLGGFSDEQIKAAALQAGWQETVVNDTFAKLANMPIITPPVPTVDKQNNPITQQTVTLPQAVSQDLSEYVAVAGSSLVSITQSLKDEPESEVTASGQTPTQSRKKWLVIFIITTILLLLGGGIFYWLYSVPRMALIGSTTKLAQIKSFSYEVVISPSYDKQVLAEYKETFGPSWELDFENFDLVFSGAIDASHEKLKSENNLIIADGSKSDNNTVLGLLTRSIGSRFYFSTETNDEVKAIFEEYGLDELLNKWWYYDSPTLNETSTEYNRDTYNKITKALTDNYPLELRKYAGIDTINGSKAYKYEIELNKEKLKAALGEISELDCTLCDDEEADLSSLDEIKSITVWVDTKNKYLVRTEIVAAFNEKGSNSINGLLKGLTVTINFSNFGQPGIIVEPENAIEFKLDDFLPSSTSSTTVDDQFYYGEQVL